MLAAGSQIAGRYELVSLIGEGSTASVWHARDDKLKRGVAIKLLYLRVHGHPQAGVEQFLREARIAAAVQHRHVVHTVDFGTCDDGTPFMVMELLQGESLAARMERVPPLGVSELVSLAEMTLRGLAAVHEAGIVHRDLKPQNIFLQREADVVYPKILDFGISRSLISPELRSPIATQQGLVVGTPYYMAPEQARGEAQIDHRADIYSMGAILYEALAGKPPFDAPTPGELLVKIVSGQPKPLAELRPDLPAALAQCVTQAMARDRAARFPAADAMRNALQAALRSAPVEPQPAAERPLLARAPAPANDGSAQAGPAAWGDFEGLPDRARRAPAPRAAEQPAASAVAAVQAPLSAAATPERLGAVAAPRQAGARARALAAPESAGNTAQAYGQNGPLLGDNPLDVFASSASAALELDLSTLSAPEASRIGEPPAKRAPLTLAAAGQAPAVQPAAGAAAAHAGPRKGSAATHARARWQLLVWALPALMWLLFLVCLLKPSLFSLEPLDQRAAQEREAHNPATRDSSRTLTRGRPSPSDAYDPGALAPAVRELLE